MVPGLPTTGLLNRRPTPGSALAALLVFVPLPTIAVLAGLWLWPGQPLGQAIWAASKVGLLLIPLLWHRLIDRQPLPRPRWNGRGWPMGLATGLAIALAIVGGYMLLGRQLIDVDPVLDRAAEARLDVLWRYALLVAYSSFINALIEEYAWRWFVFRQCHALLRGRGIAAVALAGLLFTLHHILALAAYFDPTVTALCSLGVFIGGVTWSWLYLRCGSIWPAYLSHVLADLALFAVGAWLIFG